MPYTHLHEEPAHHPWSGQYIDLTPYRDPRAWGDPNPHPRPRLSLEEWAQRRGLPGSTNTATQEDIPS